MPLTRLCLSSVFSGSSSVQNNGFFLPSWAREHFSLFENLTLPFFSLGEDNESLTRVNNRVGTGSGHVPGHHKQQLGTAPRHQHLPAEGARLCHGRLHQPRPAGGGPVLRHADHGAVQVGPRERRKPRLWAQDRHHGIILILAFCSHLLLDRCVKPQLVLVTPLCAH